MQDDQPSPAVHLSSPPLHRHAQQLHCPALPSIALHCPALPSIALHCPALPSIAQHCPALPSTAQHCPAAALPSAQNAPLGVRPLSAAMYTCPLGGLRTSPPPGKLAHVTARLHRNRRKPEGSMTWHILPEPRPLGPFSRHRIPASLAA